MLGLHLLLTSPRVLTMRMKKCAAGSVVVEGWLMAAACE